MSVSAQDLDAIVVARTGPGDEHARGRVVGYRGHPSVTIETEDGRTISWAASLCERLPDAEAADYWRRRCERQEALANPDVPEFLKRDSGLTGFGRMNRSLRVYFQITISEQAEALGLRVPELSGMEVGRIPVDQAVIRGTHFYWSSMFHEKVPA